MKKTNQLRVDLYGSLALTGNGHGTPNAVLMGLEGETPEMVNTTKIIPRVKKMEEDNELNLNGTHTISFCPKKHLNFHFNENLPFHPNGMRFSCFDENGDLLAANEFFSVGGGFVVNEKTKLADNAFFLDHRVDHVKDVPHTPSSDEEAEAYLSKTSTVGKEIAVPYLTYLMQGRCSRCY